MTLSGFNDRLCKMNLNSNQDSIVFPTLGFIWYLKSRNFDKTIYCLGPKSMKSELEKAGFKIAYSGVGTAITGRCISESNDKHTFIRQMERSCCVCKF